MKLRSVACLALAKSNLEGWAGRLDGGWESGEGLDNSNQIKAMELKPDSHDGSANERASGALLTGKNTICGTDPVLIIFEIVICITLFFSVNSLSDDVKYDLIIHSKKNNQVIEWSIRTNGVARRFFSGEAKTNLVNVKVINEIHKDALDYFILKTNKLEIYEKWKEKAPELLIVSDYNTHPLELRLLINSSDGKSRELGWFPKWSPERQRMMSDSKEEEVFIVVMTVLAETLSAGVELAPSKIDAPAKVRDVMAETNRQDEVKK